MRIDYRRPRGPVCHLFLIVLASVAFAAQVQAQIEDVEDVPPAALAGFTFMGGFPTGEFGENVTNKGIGISAYAGYMLPRAPAVIGLDLGGINYGTERRKERFSLTIPDVKVNVVTSNSILTANAFLRLQPRNGTLRPYLEGIVGIHYLVTTTTIENLGDSHEDNEIASSTNLSDHAYAWGGGAGVLIEVWSGRDNRTPDRRSVRTVSMDLRVRYHKGGAAEYLKKGDIVRRAGTTELNMTESTTHLITAHLGLSIDF